MTSLRGALGCELKRIVESALRDRGRIEDVDAFGDYDLLWQLGTAIVLIGALVFLVLAYRRRNGRD